MKISEKYKHMDVYTVGTENYSVSDSFINLFPLNGKVTDKSIYYTSGAFSEFNMISEHYKQNDNLSHIKEKESPLYTSGNNTYHSYKFENEMDYSVKGITLALGDNSSYTNTKMFCSSFNEDKSTVLNNNNAGNLKFIRNIPVRNMLVNALIYAVDKTTENIDYNNPVSISLKELNENSDKYLVTQIRLTYNIWDGTRFTACPVKAYYTCLNETNNFLYDINYLINGINFTLQRKTGGVTGTIPTTLVSFKKNAIIGELPHFDLDVLQEYNTGSAGTFIQEPIQQFSTNTVSIFAKTSYTVNSSHVVSNMTTSFNNLFTGEYVCKMLASLGLYFLYTGSITNLTPDKLMQGENVALGEMDKDGFTTGKFIVLDDIKTTKSLNRDGTTENETYNPNKTSSTDEVQPVKIHTDRGMQGGMIHYYAMTEHELNSFIEDIQSTLFKDYTDYIVSCMYFPFSVTDYFSHRYEDIILSSIEIGDTELFSHNFGSFNRITNLLYCFNLGSIYIQPQHSSFLDYAPYTDVNITTPYGMSSPVPVNLCMDNTITVDTILNISNGACKNVLSIGDTVYTHNNSAMGTFIPLSLTSSSELFKTILNTAGSVVSTVGMAVSGNTVGTVAGVLSTIQSVTSLNSISPHIVSGSGDSSTSIMLDERPVLYMSTPVEAVPSGFGHSTGYVSNKTDTVINFTGYTKFNNPIADSINCLESERNEIENLLNTGVII